MNFRLNHTNSRAKLFIEIAQANGLILMLHIDNRYRGYVIPSYYAASGNALVYICVVGLYSGVSTQTHVSSLWENVLTDYTA
jgi:hypothetical protein